MSVSSSSSTVLRPAFYGGTQDAYAIAAESAIQKGVAFLKEALSKSDANCQKIFFSLLEMFGQIRNQIANDSGSEAKECFGRRRDTDGVATNYFTYLDEQYLAYGDRLKTMLGKYLPQLMEGKAPKAGDANCQIHFRTYDIPNATKATRILLPLQPPSNPSANATAKEIKLLAAKQAEFRQKLCKLKPNDYQLVDDFANAQSYQLDAQLQMDIFSIPSNLMRFVSAKVHWTVQGKLVPVTEFVCVYDATLSPEDAVAAMMENPKVLKDFGGGKRLMEEKPCVMIRHMNRELIQPCLEMTAAIFERIVTRKSPDENTLKTDLVEMRYRFSFIMTFERGSAAVGEWFEQTLSRFHGFHSELAKGTMGDFEAFSKPFFPSFQKKYSELLTLTPLKKD